MTEKEYGTALDIPSGKRTSFYHKILETIFPPPYSTAAINRDYNNNHNNWNPGCLPVSGKRYRAPIVFLQTLLTPMNRGDH